MRRARNRALASAERLLERRGRHLLERQREEIAVGAEALEGPGEVRLRGDTPTARQVATMPSSTHARCAPSVLPAKSMLRRSLATFWNSRSVGELSMGTIGVVDEAEERVAVVLVVANRRRQRLGREERRLDGVHPRDEARRRSGGSVAADARGARRR